MGKKKKKLKKLKKLMKYYEQKMMENENGLLNLTGEKIEFRKYPTVPKISCDMCPFNEHKEGEQDVRLDKTGAFQPVFDQVAVPVLPEDRLLHSRAEAET